MNASGVGALHCDQIKGFLSFGAVASEDGNVEIGRSIGPVGVKIEIDPSAPIKNSPILNPQRRLRRGECLVGTVVYG